MKKLSITTFLLLFTLLVYGQDTTNVATPGTRPAVFHSSTGQRERTIERPKFHSYPKLPAVSKTVDNFIPKGWEILDSVLSDLNGDKVADLCLVIQYKDTVNEIMPGNWEWENRPRILVFLFKDKHSNGYKLALQNNHIIPRAGTGKQGGDPFDGLRVNNYVITIGGNMGGEYSFRFQNGDFFLISAWTNGRESPREQYSSDGTYNSDTFYYYKIDFLKGKVLSRKGLMDGQTQPEQKEVTLSRRPHIRLRNLKEFDERVIFKGFVE